MTQKFILLAVAILIMGGGYASYTTLSQSEEVQQDVVSTSDTKASEKITGKGTLLELLKNGKSVYCTFATTESDIEQTGTLQFDGSKFRVDSFAEDIDSESFDSTMIFDTERTYAWTSSGEKTVAFVFDSPTEDIFSAETFDQENEEGGVSMNESVSYECEEQTINEGVFTPPSSIQFLDLNEAFGGIHFNQ